MGGVDEAGRGPVLGPLVVACVMLDTSRRPALDDLGVKDSKLLSAARRERLAVAIRALPSVRIGIETVSAADLDARRARRSLNDIEAQCFAATIVQCLATHALAHAHAPPDALAHAHAPPDALAHAHAHAPPDAHAHESCTRHPFRNVRTTATVTLDAADPVAATFAQRVERYLSSNDTESVSTPVSLIAEHKADLNHPIVAAASIIAKTTRDAQMAAIGAELEAEVGSGYPGDERTIAFIQSYITAHNDLPPHTRRSWQTAKRLLEEHRFPPTRLTDFFN